MKDFPLEERQAAHLHDGGLPDLKEGRRPVGVLLSRLATRSADPARARFVREMTALSETVLDELPGVQSLTGEEIERLYPVLEKHSPEGERLGRIPYTDLISAPWERRWSA